MLISFQDKSISVTLSEKRGAVILPASGALDAISHIELFLSIRRFRLGSFVNGPRSESARKSLYSTSKSVMVAGSEWPLSRWKALLEAMREVKSGNKEVILAMSCQSSKVSASVSVVMPPKADIAVECSLLERPTLLNLFPLLQSQQAAKLHFWNKDIDRKGLTPL